MKQCSKCQEKKDFSEFYPNKSTSSGLDSQCKECRKKKRNENWHNNYNGQKDRDKITREARGPEFRVQQFVYRLQHNFNMSLEQYEAMLESQGGVCKLCGLPETKEHHMSGTVQRLAVDHDHACCLSTPTCGKCTRGLLCSECNGLLGKIERTPGLEQKIIEYLTS